MKETKASAGGDEMAQHMTYDQRRRRRDPRPLKMDCKTCGGVGAKQGSASVYCEDCGGTGIGAIPWAELFKCGRLK